MYNLAISKIDYLFSEQIFIYFDLNVNEIGISETFVSFNFQNEIEHHCT